MQKYITTSLDVSLCLMLGSIPLFIVAVVTDDSWLGEAAVGLSGAGVSLFLITVTFVSIMKLLKGTK